MAWQDTMGEILRSMVDDLDDDNRKFTDERLERVLVVAAFQVSQELEFSQTFVSVFDNTEITPDPTLTATKDDSFTNLTCMKAACIIDRGSAATAASQAIAVKDGTSSIDLRGILGGKLKLLEKGWCAVYDDAKFEYQSGSVRIAGAAVMTPFRLYGSPIAMVSVYQQ